MNRRGFLLDAPVAGNPAGDVTIVAFMDYNCPFCKLKSAHDLLSFQTGRRTVDFLAPR